MQTLCPNCKADSDLVVIEQVEYIQCPECGWFETQQDGSVTACDEPVPAVQEVVSPEEPARQSSEDVQTSPPSSASSDGPVPKDDEPDDEDEDSITVKLKFED